MTPFTLEMAALQTGSFLLKWCGVVAGYSTGLQVKRWMRDGIDTLGVFLRVDTTGFRDTLEKMLPAGDVFAVDLSPLSPDRVKRSFDHYFQTSSYGWPNIFNKPWAEIVNEGSAYLPDGKLQVKATVKLLK